MFELESGMKSKRIVGGDIVRLVSRQRVGGDNWIATVAFVNAPVSGEGRAITFGTSVGLPGPGALLYPRNWVDVKQIDGKTRAVFEEMTLLPGQLIVRRFSNAETVDDIDFPFDYDLEGFDGVLTPPENLTRRGISSVYYRMTDALRDNLVDEGVGLYSKELGPSRPFGNTRMGGMHGGNEIHETDGWGIKTSRALIAEMIGMDLMAERLVYKLDESGDHLIGHEDEDLHGQASRSNGYYDLNALGDLGAFVGYVGDYASTRIVDQQHRIRVANGNLACRTVGDPFAAWLSRCYAGQASSMALRYVEGSRQLVAGGYPAFGHIGREQCWTGVLMAREFLRTFSLRGETTSAALLWPVIEKFVGHVEGTTLSNGICKLIWAKLVGQGFTVQGRGHPSPHPHNDANPGGFGQRSPVLESFRFPKTTAVTVTFEQSFADTMRCWLAKCLDRKGRRRRAKRLVRQSLDSQKFLDRLTIRTPDRAYQTKQSVGTPWYIGAATLPAFEPAEDPSGWQGGAESVHVLNACGMIGTMMRRWGKHSAAARAYSIALPRVGIRSSDDFHKTVEDAIRRDEVGGDAAKMDRTAFLFALATDRKGEGDAVFINRTARFLSSRSDPLDTDGKKK